MVNLPRGWPVCVREDATGEAEERRGAKGTILGVVGKSTGGSFRSPGKGYQGQNFKTYQVIFEDETKPEKIDEVWLVPERVLVSLVDVGGNQIDKVHTGQPLEKDQKITIEVAVWSVKSLGAVKLNATSSQYEQTSIVTRYI